VGVADRVVRTPIVSSDVLSATKEAIGVLARGENPYSHVYQATIPPGGPFPYPPGEIAFYAIPNALFGRIDTVDQWTGIAILFLLGSLTLVVGPGQAAMATALYATFNLAAFRSLDGSNDVSLSFLLVLATVLLAWSERAGGSSRWLFYASAVTFGWAMLFKQFAILTYPFIVLYLRRRGLAWQRHATIAVSLVILIIMPFFVTAPVDFSRRFLRLGAHDDVWGLNMWTALGSMMPSLVEGIRPALPIVTVVAIVIVGVWLMTHPAPSIGGALAQGLGLLFTTLFLANWTTSSYYVGASALVALVVALTPIQWTLPDTVGGQDVPHQLPARESGPRGHALNERHTPSDGKLPLMSTLPSTPLTNRWQGISLLLDQPGVQYSLLIMGILICAFGLRFYDLNRNPAELFEDELSGAVASWAIATTGHDLERTWLPFFVTRLDMKPPLYGYSTVPFQAVFGHAPWVIRFPAVLSGVASTGLIVWFMRLLRQSRGEALLAASMFAIVPWAVHYGRIGWEPAILPPISLGGLGLLWTGLRDQRAGRVVAAGGLLALGAYAYTPALFIHVLLAAMLIGFFLRQLQRRDITVLLMAASLGLLVLTPYVVAFVTEPLFTVRTQRISVFRDGISASAIGMTWQHYWEQWNPQWLFLSAPQSLRNHPGIPMLFAWMAPFLVLGIWRLGGRRNAEDRMLLAWLALGPLPAALTDDGVPHFTRGLLALPPLVMITATGLTWVGTTLWRRWCPWALPALAGLLVIVLAQGMNGYRYYFGEYRTASAPGWYYGTGTALRTAGSIVPPSGLLCVHHDAVSYFTFWHYIDYYLGDRSFRVIEGTPELECSQPGTFILETVDTQLAIPMATVATIPDISGRPRFEIEEVTES